MTNTWSLQSLADLAIITSTEQQRHLAERHAKDSVSFEPGDGTVVLSSPDGAELVCEAHLLGAVTPDGSRWRWSWGEFEGLPDHAVEVARQVRDTGTEHGVDEFVTPVLPFADGLPSRLTLAAKAATGRYTHCSFTALDGSRWSALIGHPSFDLPAPDARRIERSITDAVAGGGVHDHAAAVASYARLRGIEHRLADDDALLLEVPDGSVVVRFDEHLHVAGITRTDASVGV
jgi:hypothetical protein